MKLAVIGSRTWTNQSLLENTLATFCKEHNVSEIISGGACGADIAAENWAFKQGIARTVFDADWNKYGRGAGPIRNAQIVAAADAVLAFVVPETCKDCAGTGCNGAPLIYQKCNPCKGRAWNPTRGTANTLRRAQSAGKACWIVTEEGGGEVKEWR